MQAPHQLARGEKTPSPIRLALSYVRGHKRRLGAAVFWQGVYELGPMQVPLLTGVLVDGLIHRRVSLYGVVWDGLEPLAVLRLAALGLLALALVQGYAAYARTVATAKLSRNFVSTLRMAVLEKVALVSLDAHQRYGAAELLDRVLTDTNRARHFMERVFIQTTTKVVRAGYPVVMLLLIDPPLAAIALAVLPPQFFLSWYLQRRLHSATRRSRESRSDLVTEVKENIDGIETVKTLNAEALALARMNTRAERVETDEISASRLSALLSGAVWLTTSLGVALAWWQGGMRVYSGEMTLGTLVVFTGFVALAYQPFRQLTTIARIYRQELVSLERIQDLLEVPLTITDPPSAPPLGIREGRVEFRHVFFRYGERPVLKDVTLTMEPRQLTAVVGRTGSGKSSMLRLIARLYDPDKGQVLIDGQALAQISLASLRSQIAVVPQRPVLFTGTVRENICLARPDAPAAEVTAACESAGLLPLIEGLANGLDTHLGRRGVSLSGGEIQRLAVARALLTHPKVLLMDEPTSALDAGAEAALVETLLRLRGKITVVVVAHRLETVRHADRVLVLDAGRVVAEGSHDELLLGSGLYLKLFGTRKLSHADTANSLAR